MTQYFFFSQFFLPAFTGLHSLSVFYCSLYFSLLLCPGLHLDGSGMMFILQDFTWHSFQRSGALCQLQTSWMGRRAPHPPSSWVTTCTPHRLSCQRRLGSDYSLAQEFTPYHFSDIVSHSFFEKTPTQCYFHERLPKKKNYQRSWLTGLFSVIVPWYIWCCRLNATIYKFRMGQYNWIVI